MMSNQVEHCLPKENRVEKFPAEIITENKDLSICHVLKSFVRVWLPLIGIHLSPSPNQNVSILWLTLLY